MLQVWLICILFVSLSCPSVWFFAIRLDMHALTFFLALILAVLLHSYSSSPAISCYLLFCLFSLLLFHSSDFATFAITAPKIHAITGIHPSSIKHILFLAFFASSHSACLAFPSSHHLILLPACFIVAEVCCYVCLFIYLFVLFPGQDILRLSWGNLAKRPTALIFLLCSFAVFLSAIAISEYIDHRARIAYEAVGMSGRAIAEKTPSSYLSSSSSSCDVIVPSRPNGSLPSSQSLPNSQERTEATDTAATTPTSSSSNVLAPPPPLPSASLQTSSVSTESTDTTSAPSVSNGSIGTKRRHHLSSLSSVAAAERAGTRSYLDALKINLILFFPYFMYRMWIFLIGPVELFLFGLICDYVHTRCILLSLNNNLSSEVFTSIISSLVHFVLAFFSEGIFKHFIAI